MVDQDPLAGWVVLMLLAILGINACTAVSGVALRQHAASRALSHERDNPD
jgi:hypothetical protein